MPLFLSRWPCSALRSAGSLPANAKSAPAAKNATTTAPAIMTNTYKKSDPATIRSMFNTIAPTYDLANRVMSFNLNKLWNRSLIKETLKGNPDTILDLCCGTGEISYSWLKMQPERKKAILLDFSSEMLAQAKKRAPSGHDIEWIEADAQAIPLPNTSVDAITAAYGIRNVKDTPLCFKEAIRVLKPGGSFGILDLTEPKNRLLRPLHRFYLSTFIPTIGGLLTFNPRAYSYLSRSIHQFMKPEAIRSQLLDAGFKTVTVKPLSFGIAHLWIANK